MIFNKINEFFISILNIININTAYNKRNVYRDYITSIEIKDLKSRKNIKIYLTL